VAKLMYITWKFEEGKKKIPKFRISVTNVPIEYRLIQLFQSESEALENCSYVR